ncbi:hypothetical protein ABZW11_39155 [Nonomuraea sp. NPDC004580]
MPTKEQVLRLLSQGHDSTEIAVALVIPAGQARLAREKNPQGR